MPMSITMVDPRGEECIAGSPTDVTDLMAQGYVIKGHVPALQRTEAEEKFIASLGQGSGGPDQDISLSEGEAVEVDHDQVAPYGDGGAIA